MAIIVDKFVVRAIKFIIIDCSELIETQIRTLGNFCREKTDSKLNVTSGINDAKKYI